jgi:predicted DNA-binding transcriptional regulator YafY
VGSAERCLAASKAPSGWLAESQRAHRVPDRRRPEQIGTAGIEQIGKSQNAEVEASSRIVKLGRARIPRVSNLLNDDASDFASFQSAQRGHSSVPRLSDLFDVGQRGSLRCRRVSLPSSSRGVGPGRLVFGRLVSGRLVSG